MSGLLYSSCSTDSHTSCTTSNLKGLDCGVPHVLEGCQSGSPSGKMVEKEDQRYDAFEVFDCAT